MLDIAEVAERSGFSTSALRYYESKGLIRPVSRRGLRRQFTDDVVERLALIALGREAGFSLEEIASIFGDGGAVSIDRGRLRARREEISKSIERLSRLRDLLEHTADCPASDHLACPSFQRLLRGAQQRSRRSTAGGKKHSK